MSGVYHCILIQGLEQQVANSMLHTTAESVYVPLQRVWDELDSLHSRLAAVEQEFQDLSEEKPEEMQALSKKLSQTQQLHTSLSKQAEDRTAFLNKARLIQLL